jgi:hypothetical protein
VGIGVGVGVAQGALRYAAINVVSAVFSTALRAVSVDIGDIDVRSVNSWLALGAPTGEVPPGQAMVP